MSRSLYTDFTHIQHGNPVPVDASSQDHQSAQFDEFGSRISAKELGFQLFECKPEYFMFGHSFVSTLAMEYVFLSDQSVHVLVSIGFRFVESVV